ncbi:hypothetical protein CQA86_17690 [Klebsiella pneumoniae]|nr:hypothetical protein CQA86_17690 [Klebsiella pneumoniae]
MSTYKTKNPLGSAAVKDLYDNAENVDKFVNDRTKEELEDRLGVLRKTWHGMEMIFSRFIDYITGRGERAVAAIGWQELGNWAVGLAVDNRQQIVYYNGSWYKYLGELAGIRDGAVIKRLPGEARVMLPLQTSGGEGRRWWFINGEPLEAAGARTTLMLDKPGEWQLVVMDEAGQTAAASFTLQ